VLHGPMVTAMRAGNYFRPYHVWLDWMVW